MLQAQVKAREISDRLRRPVGGIHSPETDVLSGPAWRRRRMNAAAEAAAARAAFAREMDERARPIVAIFRGFEPASTPPPISIILGTVSRYFDISVLEIRSDRRMSYLITPRHVVMYLARHLTTLSLPAIGRRLGRKDHTTVLSAVKKIEQRLLVDQHLAADIDNIKWELGIR